MSAAARNRLFDLSQYQSDCERCFYLIRQLVSDWRDESLRQIAIPELGGQILGIRVLRREKHTGYVDIYCPNLVSTQWVQPIVARVTIYFDVGMAEIVDWNGSRVVWPRLQYPNRQQFSSDEKCQRMDILLRWLMFARKFGVDIEAPLCGTIS